MKIAIHQPNFIPWFPFFQKIESADIFVILSNCQFEKNGFQNRFNMNDRWFTMSTNKGLQPINKKQYVNCDRDWSKIKKSLHDYDLSVFDDCVSSSLSDTNTCIIKKICRMLKIKTKIVSDIPTAKSGTDRLVEICKAFSGTSYISGTSGRKYMTTNLFDEHDMELSFQNEKSMLKKPVLEVLKGINYV